MSHIRHWFKRQKMSGEKCFSFRYESKENKKNANPSLNWSIYSVQKKGKTYYTFMYTENWLPDTNTN